MVAPVLLVLGSGLLSMGIGYGVRKYLLHDPTPAEPQELALDFVTGAAFPVFYAPAEAVATKALGRTIAGRLTSAVISGAAAGAGTGMVTDIAEDLLQKEKPKLEPKEHGYYIPHAVLGGIGAGIGEGIGIAAERIAPKVPIPKVGKVDLPDEEAGYWAGLYIEKGHEAKPLIGLTRKGIALGKPRIRITQAAFKEGAYLPKSPIETALTFDDLIDYYTGIGAKEEAERLMQGYKLLVYSKNVNVPIQKSIKEVIEESPRLKDVADDLARWIKAQKDIEVYGSIAQKMHMGEAMSRQPHDIDIVVPNAEKKAKELLRILQKKLGNQVRINPQHPTLIERKIGNAWVHLVDIHDKGSIVSYLFGGASPFDDTIGFGFRRQPPVIHEGTPVMRISEQAIRKGVSSITPREYGVNPEPHRVKDILDFMEIEKFFAEHLKKTGKKSTAEAIEEALKKFAATRDEANIFIPKHMLGRGINLFAKETAEETPKTLAYWYYAIRPPSPSLPAYYAGATAASIGSRAIAPVEEEPSPSPAPSERPSPSTSLSALPSPSIALPPSPTPSPSAISLPSLPSPVISPQSQSSTEIPPSKPPATSISPPSRIQPRIPARLPIIAPVLPDYSKSSRKTKAKHAVRYVSEFDIS